MRKKTIIVGGGGHARSVLDIALQMEELEIAGCVDRNQTDVLGVSVIGTDDDLEKLYASGIHNAFIALGDNKLRDRLYRRLKEIGFSFVNIVSRYAVVSPRADLGEGICVMPGAVIHVNARIGDNCIINTNCNIDHDCIIGYSCHIAPGVSMSGAVNVGSGAHIGTGASVIDGISIGEWSYIGAGAAVVSDLPEHVMAYGVPAKIRRMF